MKKKDKNLLLFTLFLTVLVVSLPSIMKGDSKETTNFGFNLEGSQVSWNVSEYDEFIGPAINTTSAIMKFRIYIRDDDPNYNWTKTEADFEWCTGSGTEGDPYIIENLYIDAQGEGGGMYIRNTDKYFVIRNCWINNSEVIKYGAAIFLEYAVNLFY